MQHTVCYILYFYLTGFGGQIDFIRGAAICLDGRGKPIIAMPSATRRGETKIVPTLKLGKIEVELSSV
jgi:acyl-CoA hydrolase